MSINKIYLKWLFLVLFNAICGIIFGSMIGETLYWYIGMTLGIAAWWLIYSNLELYFRIRGYTNAVNSLTYSAFLKMGIQPIYIIDVYIGLIVMGTIEKLGLMKYDLIAAYLATIGVGTVYGAIVAVLFLIILWINRIDFSHLRNDRSTD